jgi:hypothetical protein
MSAPETKKIVVSLDSIKSRAKTLKNTKSDEPLVPTVSPNKLKDELLNKIKHHKTKKNTPVNNDQYTNEFYKSIEYLNNMKMKKESKEKQEQKKFANQTINGHNITLKNNAHKYIQLELPEELAESNITLSIQETPSTQIEPVKQTPIISTSSASSSNTNNTNSIYNVDKDVPYGCLKNGMKPNYRTWRINQTRKNVSYNEPVNMSTTNKLTIDPTPSFNEVSVINEPIILNDMNELSSTNEPIILNQQTLQEVASNIEQPIQIQSSNNINTINSNELTKPENIKSSFIKTTTTKTHSLGKSKTHRKVGILIKNKKTQKNVMEAYKNLKKTSINDVKKYLKKQGLIKVGSTAPVDVLRKTFESSILAGEIINKNQDVLYHNYVNDK